jgi:hypothetical protein
VKQLRREQTELWEQVHTISRALFDIEEGERESSGSNGQSLKMSVQRVAHFLRAGRRSRDADDAKWGLNQVQVYRTFLPDSRNKTSGCFDGVLSLSYWHCAFPLHCCRAFSKMAPVQCRARKICRSVISLHFRPGGTGNYSSPHHVGHADAQSLRFDVCYVQDVCYSMLIFCSIRFE